MEMAYVEVDLGELVQAVAGHFDALARQRQIAFVVDAPTGLRAEVDSEKIERIVLNLLANAFKFTPAGGRITCLLRLDNDGTRVSVQDSGPGIRPELRQRVFERFRRADGDTTREFGQTGLGLAIARDFVELHGGTIGVTDAPGGGALFQVELPRRAPAGVRVGTDVTLSRGASDPVVRGTLDELKPSAGPTTLVEASAQRPRVLVVDDSPEMLRLVDGLLSEDFNVVTASDAPTALEKATQPGLDLIITDIMMPGMSGEQLIAAIRRRPELGNIPILILSAKANDALRARLLREGVQDYVVKPLSGEELRARALNLAQVKRARDVLQTELMSQSHDLEALARQLAAEKQRALEAQRKADLASRAKDEFLAVLSHELRTPLNAILGWLTILRRAATGTPEHERALDVIERNARAQGRLVDDILDVSAMIQGRMRLRLDPLRLGPVLAAALDAVRPAAEAKGVEILSHCDERELTVHGDADRLRQVFYNLLNNAIKFTPEGGHVMVGAGLVDDAIVVSVQDTGIGIEAAFLPHVFDRFGQGNATGARGGLGLGLAIARHLVELHGGRIEARSAGEGRGATFTVRLPLAG
jgi:signal transduction histidine kinase